MIVLVGASTREHYKQQVIGHIVSYPLPLRLVISLVLSLVLALTMQLNILITTGTPCIYYEVIRSTDFTYSLLLRRENEINKEAMAAM